MYRIIIAPWQFALLKKPEMYVELTENALKILEEYGYHSYSYIREHGVNFYQFAFRDERALELNDPVLFKLTFL